ncbi:MAG: SDR family NAD(P)-dependent oxidoreductase [Hydrotalea sp.]|jgi:NADP-dependent 3-hydroxy acid dehydrogenase YdfG|nr:SDR family NAD(P)-dependent oxidoreductase [Hydrotalea sp.]
MSRIVCVTGATSGFGKAIAEKFLAEGSRVITTGRRKDRLEKDQKLWEEKYGANKVFSIVMDVQDQQDVEKGFSSLPEEWQAIDVLVNNAGLALGRDSFDQANLQDWETMWQTNVMGLVYVTRAVLPHIIKRKGHIINIGSIAGKEVYPEGNMYCASKHAVDALSKSMRIDLLQHGVKVTAIHPGAAETEFSLVRYKGDASKAAPVYAGYQPLSAEDIADITYFAASLPPHVCINDLVVTPTAQANSVLVHKNA